MSYAFIDGYGSVLTAESSVVVGTAQRQVVAIGSVLTPITVNFSGAPSISGAVTVAGGQSSVSGVGTFNTNPVGNGSVFAVLRDSSVSGVGIFNTNHIGNGSILVVVPGSVATAPSPASVSGVGIFNVNHIGNGSIQTVSLGSIATAPSPASVSGVGLFNVNHTGNGSVISTNQVTRNDTLASFLGVNLTPRYMAGDSAGRVITKPYAASEALVQGTGSTMGISRASLLGVPGDGLRNYITDILVANTGSVATLVSFSDSDASIIGKTIAPATGGSNIRLATPMRTGAVNSQVEFIAQTGSSVLHVTALGYKAP